MDARLSGSSSRTLARFCNEPVERSSRTVTRLRPLSRSTRWDPMKPAPPVTRMRRPSMAPRRRDERAISVPVSNEASAGYMGELRTDVEESPRNRRILCGTRRSTDLHLCEVFSGDPFDLRGRREEDWRLRSLLRALEEHPNESHDGRCASHAEVRPEEPREVVHFELTFESVRGHLPMRCVHARVVDQRVEAGIRSLEFVRERVD